MLCLYQPKRWIIQKVKVYYSEKLQGYPDVIASEDVRAITGYAKETVRKWIQRGKLVGIVYKSKYVISQNDFLDFVTSSQWTVLLYLTDDKNPLREPYVKYIAILKYKELYELRVKTSGGNVKGNFHFA